MNPPYVYDAAPKLRGTPLVGTHQCVALIRFYTPAPHTSAWRPGQKVRGATDIAVGTAIATFVDGRYPNEAHGNHAAFYLGQDAFGIQVVDQWANPVKRPTILSQTLLWKPNAPYCRSDDGNLYWVIM